MLVGRELELGILNAHYEKMLAGNGSVLFLTGEAGLGKTTLVHSWKSGTLENAQRDEGRGLRDEASSLSLVPHPSTLFLESACSIPIGNVDVGRLEALQPWADIIAGIADFESRISDNNDSHNSFPKSEIRNPKSEKTPLNFKKLIHDAAPAWAWALPLVGDIAHAALETSRLVKEQRDVGAQNVGAQNVGAQNVGAHSSAPLPTENYGAQNQQQVFQQYVNVLTKISAEIPLIIFLDDLHWADTSSCNLLFYLSRQIADKKILVIATYRQDDAMQAQDGKGHAIITIKNEILRYESGREMALEMLGRNAIRALLQATFAGYAPEDRFESWLRKLSDGNALFVTQFIRTLREDGHLNEHGAFVGDYGNVTIPSTALAVVEERTRRLDDDTRELLMFATAEGEEFTTYVLERLTEKKPMVLLKELHFATGLGLISQLGTGRLYANKTTGIFGFSHALFHKALYDGLLDMQKVHLHQQCFELLRTEWDRLSQSKQRSTTLATKLLTHAERSEEWQAVAEIALEAANEFWKTYNEDEALGMTLRVHAAAGLEPAAAMQNAEAYFLEGRIGELRGRYNEALLSYRAAETAFREAGNAKRGVEAVNRVASCQKSTGDYASSMATATRALNEASLLGHATGVAALQNTIGGVHIAQSRYAEAMEYFEKSLKIQESTQDREGVAASLNNIGLVHLNQGRYTEAMEYFEKGLAIRESIQDRPGVASLLSNIGLARTDQGRYADALECFEKSLAICDAIGDLNGMAAALINMGIVHNDQGRPAEAMEHYVRGLKISESTGNRIYEVNALNNIGGVLLNQNRCAEAMEYYEKCLAIREEVGDRAGVASSLKNIGNVHESEGRYADALKCFRQSLAIRESIGDSAGVAVSLANIGAAYGELGDLPLSREYLYRALALARELNLLSFVGAIFRELGILSEAEAAPLEGDGRTAKLREAVAHMEQAIALSAELKQTMNADRYREDLVRLLRLGEISES